VPFYFKLAETSLYSDINIPFISASDVQLVVLLLLPLFVYLLHFLEWVELLVPVHIEKKLFDRRIACFTV
jgi:hypothetical protein